MICKVNMISSLAGGDDECVGGAFGHGPEVGWAAATHAADGLGYATFVDAQAAVDPVDLQALCFRLLQQRRDPFARERMCLVGLVAAMHCVGMARLARETKRDRAFISEHVDVVALLERRFEQAECGRGAI